MILPGKHIRMAESLLGLSSVLIPFLRDSPKTVDDLWNDFNKKNKNFRVIPAYHSFDKFILALDFLFLTDSIELDQDGKLQLCE